MVIFIFISIKRDFTVLQKYEAILTYLLIHSLGTVPQLMITGFYLNLHHRSIDKYIQQFYDFVIMDVIIYVYICYYENIGTLTSCGGCEGQENVSNTELGIHQHRGRVGYDSRIIQHVQLFLQLCSTIYIIQCVRSASSINTHKQYGAKVHR